MEGCKGIIVIGSLTYECLEGEQLECLCWIAYPHVVNMWFRVFDE